MEVATVDEAAVAVDEEDLGRGVGEEATTGEVGGRVEVLGAHGPKRRGVLDRRHRVVRLGRDLDLLELVVRALVEELDLVGLPVGQVVGQQLVRGLDRDTIDLLDQVAAVEGVAALAVLGLDISDVHTTGFELFGGDLEGVITAGGRDQEGQRQQRGRDEFLQHVGLLRARSAFRTVRARLARNVGRASALRQRRPRAGISRGAGASSETACVLTHGLASCSSPGRNRASPSSVHAA